MNNEVADNAWGSIEVSGNVGVVRITDNRLWHTSSRDPVSVNAPATAAVSGTELVSALAPLDEIVRDWGAGSRTLSP
jgi:hypothetical protein